jgi:hypothetical protein
MKRPARSRRTANLSQSLLHRLTMYAVAAEGEAQLRRECRAEGYAMGLAIAGIGVGALALMPLSEARIVYTPLHVNVASSQGGRSYHPTMFLDLNQDGIYDFRVASSGLGDMRAPGFGGVSVRVSPMNGANQIWGMKGLASALSSGVRIGANTKFFGKNQLMWATAWASSGNGHYGTTTEGAWNNVQNRYLGLKFIAGGQAHYGWARLSVTGPMFTRPLVTLTGFAYETIPNKAIITGKTSGNSSRTDGSEKASTTAPPAPSAASLGRLAQGAPGLMAWRTPR